MGYGAGAYAVDISRIKAQLGSGTTALADRYAASFDAFLREIAADASLPPADVARHMIMGEPRDERALHLYGYFFQHLCALHGRRLDDTSWTPVTVSFPAQLDELLDRENIALPRGFSIEDLIFGGAPVDLPMTDFPAFGHLPHAELKPAADALAVVGRLSDRDDIDPVFIGALYDVFQWLSHADNDGTDLVTFFS